MAEAMALMQGHLRALAGKGGRLLEPFQLKEVSACIRTLRGTGKFKPAAQARVTEISGEKLRDLMAEAARYPELQEAIAAIDGNRSDK